MKQNTELLREKNRIFNVEFFVQKACPAFLLKELRHILKDNIFKLNLERSEIANIAGDLSYYELPKRLQDDHTHESMHNDVGDNLYLDGLTSERAIKNSLADLLERDIIPDSKKVITTIKNNLLPIIDINIELEQSKKIDSWLQNPNQYDLFDINWKPILFNLGLEQLKRSNPSEHLEFFINQLLNSGRGSFIALYEENILSHYTCPDNVQWYVTKLFPAFDMLVNYGYVQDYMSDTDDFEQIDSYSSSVLLFLNGSDGKERISFSNSLTPSPNNEQHYGYVEKERTEEFFYGIVGSTSCHSLIIFDEDHDRWRFFNISDYGANHIMINSSPFFFPLIDGALDQLYADGNIGEDWINKINKWKERVDK
jgi:hypothetical protein